MFTTCDNEENYHFMKIYTITATYINEKMSPKEFRFSHPDYSRRPWGYFHSFEEVLDYLKTDNFNIQECLYNYVVVEEFCPGIPAFCDKEGQNWFKFNENWSYLSNDVSRWVLCERPKHLENIVNFALG